MSQSTRCLFGWAAVTITAAAAVLMPPPAPREPFDERRCEVRSVMLLDEATTSTYVLDAPLRVIRDGRVTLSHRDVSSRLPVVRVDLTIDGESVTVFSRLRGPD